MEIKEATFVKSSRNVAECPEDDRVELALIGRSNVGKSSLINMLTHRKDLAKTSQTPGKTRLINHFLIDDRFYIVDLPGYGYAKVPLPMRKQLEAMIDDYISRRWQMSCLFVLVDIRHAPMKIDLDFITHLGTNRVPFALIFTKADKLTKTAARRSVDAYMAELSKDWEELPPYFVTSSLKGEGREELLDYFESLL
jgi:GTP-binding protein